MLKGLGSLESFHFLAVLYEGGGTKLGVTYNWSLQLSTEGLSGCQLSSEQKQELIYVAGKSHHNLWSCGSWNLST